jgi:drug/metabolite transporter (DMT)-like permease
MTQVLFTFALLPSALLAWRSKGRGAGSNRLRGLGWGFVSGLFAGVGDLCYYLALQSGADAAIAIPLISLYPLVTLTLAFFWFKERLNRAQAIGIALAVVAIFLLSGGIRAFGSPGEMSQRLSLTPWVLYSLAALFCAGAFTATQKLSTNHVSAEASFLAWCSALVVIALWVVATKSLSWHIPLPLLGSALAAGALNGFGVIAAFAAYRNQGKAAIVAPLTAMLQPLVTVVLALLFLGESVGLVEGGGILLAIIAAAALAQEGKKPLPPG